MDSAASSTPKPTSASNDIPIDIIEEKTLLHDKWLGVRQVIYKHRRSDSTPNPEPDAKDLSKLPLWQVAYRTTTPQTAKVDGVSVIATLIKTSADGSRKEKFLVLVKQFRVPIMKYSLEFPAGILDPNENPIEAGLRELKEETGYTATKVLGITDGIQGLDPGLAADTINFLMVEIDGDAAENHESRIKQQLDESERIDVILLPFDRLMESFRDLTKSGVSVEAMVYSFAIGTVYKDGQASQGLVL